ncbi:MAG: hypothetical protein Kow0063_00850 [Anaerolineae bacterium]
MVDRIRHMLVLFGERQRQAWRAQSGQSLIILAFAFLGLVAMLGLALDLGLVYIERVRIKRAVDAATLAGVVELPFEEDAFSRAIEYLNLNGYNIDPVAGDADVYVVGCIEDPPGSGTFVDHTTPYPYIQVLNPRTVFTITAVPAPGTTRDSSVCNVAANNYGNANRLSVTGTVTVDMNFMQFFGFGEVPVIDWAVAQNVTDLDVAVVFDISGSMEHFTVCYDCWVRTDSSNPDYPNNGYYNPIPASVITSPLCAATQTPYVESGYRYLIAEAELAAFNPPLWQTRYRQVGQGYWAIQRGSRNGDRNNRAGDVSQQSSNVCLPGTGVDCTLPGTSDHLCNNDPGNDVRVDCSGYISHHPFATYGQGAPPAELLGMFYYLEDVIDQDPPPPRLEYDFTPDWTGSAYIWLRAQGGGDRAYEPIYQNPFILNKSTIHWAVFFPSTGVQTTPQSDTQAPGNNRWRDNRAEPGEWRWIRLNSSPISVVSGQTFILRLWAGSPGYDIDKIVVTSDPRSNWSNINVLNYDTPAANIGRPATPGSATRAACDPCNPIYGLSVTPDQCTGYSPVLTPTNNLANPLFGDLEPIRTSKEAVKRFIQRLDPEFDQAGFVPFTTDVDRYDQAQLACRKRNGQACFEAVAGVPGSPISYTAVLASVEEPLAWNSTDIAEGMRNGLEVLGVNVRNLPECTGNQNPYDNNCFDNSCDPEDERTSCGRGGAATRVMVVLTDGSPNTNPGGCGNDPVYYFPYENDDDYDCVIYYAGKALQNNVIVYTIGLGEGARGDLLGMAAETARGKYFYAPTPDDLDAIFDEILQNIYVRLIR